MPAAASYIGTDTATLGTWTGSYGTNGQVIANDVSNVPAYALLGTTGVSTYTGTTSTTDPCALQISSGSSSRIASAYNSSGSFTLDLNLTDGNTHRISLYLCDWDNSGRTEIITVVNAATQAVLSTKTFSSFSACGHLSGHGYDDPRHVDGKLWCERAGHSRRCRQRSFLRCSEPQRGKRVPLGGHNNRSARPADF